VAREIERAGLKIAGRRIKVLGVELDLLAIGPLGQWIIIEVKSLGPAGWPEVRVTWRQRARLRRAADALAQGWRVPGTGHRSSEIELWLALVGEGPVQLIQDFA
jgi:Holliday junction resolvase-like predicted endonuclease